MQMPRRHAAVLVRTWLNMPDTLRPLEPMVTFSISMYSVLSFKLEVVLAYLVAVIISRYANMLAE